MLKSLFKDAFYMAVSEGIMDNLALPVVLDEIGKPQRFQLMRYCGFCHTKQDGQVTNAHFFT